MCRFWLRQVCVSANVCRASALPRHILVLLSEEKKCLLCESCCTRFGMSPKICHITTPFLFSSRNLLHGQQHLVPATKHTHTETDISASPKLSGTTAGEQLRFVTHLYSEHAFVPFSLPEPLLSRTAARPLTTFQCFY